MVTSHQRLGSMAVSASARGPQSRARLDRPLSRHRTWPMPASSRRKRTARARKFLRARARCLGVGHHGEQALRETPVVFHTQSNWPPAIEVARSGATELQGFLWADGSLLPAPPGSGCPGTWQALPRLSTYSQLRLSTPVRGADQRIYQNPPQTYAQELTHGALFWQAETVGEHEPEQRACDIALYPPARPAGGDLHAHRLLATGGPGQVFAARGRDLMSDQTLGGTPTYPVSHLPGRPSR